MIFTRSDVSFSKADLVALLAHASKDETRAHLAAVHFDGYTGRAFAADGHRMAIRKGDGEAPWCYVVGRAALEAAAKTPKAAVYILHPSTGDIVAMSKANAKLATIQAPHVTDAKGARVPVLPVDQIVGAPASSHVRQMVNPRYLADLVYVADAAGETMVRAYPAADEGDPMQYHVGPWIVEIMPGRLDAFPTEHAADKAALAAYSNAKKAKPSTAIVLASAPTPIVNAPSLGPDKAPQVSSQKSDRRQWREAYASTVEDQNVDVVRAWVDSADDVRPTNATDRPPWG